MELKIYIYCVYSYMCACILFFWKEKGNKCYRIYNYGFLSFLIILISFV